MQLDNLRILPVERLNTWCDEYGSVTWIEEGLVSDVGRASREVLDLMTEMDALANNGADGRHLGTHRRHDSPGARGNDESSLEEFVHQLERYLETSGYLYP